MPFYSFRRWPVEKGFCFSNGTDTKRRFCFHSHRPTSDSQVMESDTWNADVRRRWRSSSRFVFNSIFWRIDVRSGGKLLRRGGSDRNGWPLGCPVRRGHPKSQRNSDRLVLVRYRSNIDEMDRRWWLFKETARRKKKLKKKFRVSVCGDPFLSIRPDRTFSETKIGEERKKENPSTVSSRLDPYIEDRYQGETRRVVKRLSLWPFIMAQPPCLFLGQ